MVRKTSSKPLKLGRTTNPAKVSGRAKQQNKQIPAPTEKLQKVLASMGLGSRREMERWIEAGRIKVNNQRASLGDRVQATDLIKVDNKLVRHRPSTQRRTRVLIYNKPAGEMCTRKDPEGRKTVFEGHRRLKHGRWIMVGRLDYQTSGLLLFTNNGELANQLMHPSSALEREYAVRVFGEVSETALKQMQQGVTLEDGPAKFERIKPAGGEAKNHWYHVMLKEGRNREVRRIWASQGIEVNRLIRLRFGDIHLPRGLRQGQLIELEPEQVNPLIRQVSKQVKD